MKFTTFLVVAAVLVISAFCFGSELLVPSEYPTIQAGIDAAVDGDTVVIADGIYTGEGNRDIDFGGKAITVKSENGAENCVIDCQGSEDEPHRGFYFHSFETSESIVEGFTIIHGFGPADLTDSVTSGENVVSTITLSSGGAIFCESSSPTIKDCIIRDNEAMAGGGLCFSRDSDAEVINCIVSENTATMSGSNFHLFYYAGGGLFSFESSPILKNCVFNNNISYSLGAGGVTGCNGYLTMENCTIANNSSTNVDSYGGGIVTVCHEPITPIPGVYSTLIFNCSSASMNNCIVYGNETPSGLDIISQPFDAQYSCLQGLTENPGVGNFDADPMFVGVAIGDFSLLPDSPCINSGDPNFVADDGETDIEGNLRVSGGRVDVGAYEYPNAAAVSDAGADQTVYAGVDGAAVVLDGSGSSDGDGDLLEYFWYEGDELIGEGVSPTVVLGVGEHVIELIVNDGVEDSLVDACLVTVVGAIEGNMMVLPRRINRFNRAPYVFVMFVLPAGIGADDIDGGMTLYPGGVESGRVWESRYGRVFASFSKSSVMASNSGNGPVEMEAELRLNSGEYVVGSSRAVIMKREENSRQRTEGRGRRGRR